MSSASPGRGLSRTSLLVALVLIVATPVTAWAQAGWYITPSLTLSEEFDDNVFLRSSGRESDVITRASPSLKAGYQSKPFTLLLSGGIDAEYFAEHPELSGAANRKRAALELRWVPELTGPTTTLGANVLYAESQSAGELQPQTGIEAGRRTTRLWSFSPSVTHRFSTLTSGSASYSYGELSSGDFTSVSHQARVGISSQLTRMDTGSLNYSLSVVDSAGETTTSHAITAGWISRLSRSTTLSLEGGPRISDGNIEPQITAGLAHTFNRTGQATLTYQRAETVVIDQPGTSETNSVLAGLTLELTRRLRSSFGAGVSVTDTPNAGDVTTYRANASLSYRLTKWLALGASYRYLQQDQGRIRLYHNVFSVTLDAVQQLRAD